ncbi:PREDICTED: peroxisome assembly protein 12 [Dufourea novaeangliae]|uniref:peroxisome assembly protein 12 n=1 Tax=Dufourea novaeangliae TaxID=178035 RepID=UPI000767B713|nr:PREDICTED: peroxisome assembly protein 12 [Dufourea novaeangliae]
MAEKGAHLTGTTLIRPSIFEIIAQESFASTVEPAFKKLLSFVVSFNPERYGHLLRWADEGYLIFNVILQKHYFKKYSASFSEAFYGLKRIAIIDSKIRQKLPKKRAKLSLVLLVLFPYLKSKLYQLAQRYRLEEADDSAPQTKWQKLYRHCVVKGCTISFIIYEFIVLYNYILYIAGKSVYQSPLLRLLSVTLTYAEPERIISISDLLRKIRNNSFNITDGMDILQRTVTTSLELGAFFLQFVSWWTQEHHYKSLMTLPTPPPPTIPETARQHKGKCPVCCKAPRVPTVLPISGYAFCYQCILPVIRKTGKCPVTNYPAKEDDLIRLYLD